MHVLKDIWIHVDPAARSGEALAVGLDLARRGEARLTLVGALGRAEGPIFDTAFGHDLRRLIHEDRLAHLAELERQARGALPPERVRARLLEGEVPWHTVVADAVQHDPDLLIVPSDRAHPGEVESTVQHFIRKFPAAVWAVAPGAVASPRRILVALDPGLPGTDERRLAREVLAVAAGLGAAGPAELHVAHAYDLFGEGLIRARFGASSAAGHLEQTRQAAQDRLRAALAEAAVAPLAGTHLLRGPASAVVPDVAERIGADLVVLGTAARTGLAGFLIGSSAEAILARLGRSVAVVKHPAFVSPVRPRAAAA